VVHTLDVLTLRLAEAIGIYLIVAGVSGLRMPARWREIVDDIDRSAGTADLFGIAAFVVGVAILIPHHQWSDPLAIVVTVLAWVSLLEGVALLAFPDLILPAARAFARAARSWAVVSLVAGSILFLAGLTGRADALV
jgi:uncharacterized protein YjeT (DUF2065 family)